MCTRFMNPILPGFNPDPSIARVGNDFFLTTSTFEYFPGLPIYHSEDLINWNLIGHALTRRSQLEMRTVEPGAGIWAPTLRWRKNNNGENGRFYLATCKWDRYRPQTDERIFPRGFFVFTDNIWDETAWSDPIYFDNPGFDQDIFWDDDGKVYLSTTTRLADRPKESKLKDFAIHISEIDLNTGKSLTAPKVIRSSPHGIAEGSHIIKRGRYYYLFTAEGGTESGHQEWVSRSEQGPLGPWILGPRNPLWYNGTNEDVQNTGHVDVFEDAESRWWAVLLGVRPRKVRGEWKDSPLGRESFLVRVHWIDDWPVFNYGHNIGLLTTSTDTIQEKGDPFQHPKGYCWYADLDREDLEIGWYQKNSPLKSSYSLTERPGCLRFYGNCHNLSSPEAPAMLLRKQTHLLQRFTAVLDFCPSKLGYEAGIVVWWNMYSYASVGITLNTVDGTLAVVWKTPCYKKQVPLAKIVERARFSSRNFVLNITSKESTYDLEFIDNESEYSESQTVPTSKLIIPPPIGGAFTGMMFGLYAFGNGEPCLDPADFSEIAHYTNEKAIGYSRES